MTSPFDPVTFDHGPAMANRFMLAPLTNLQSHADGTLSDEEYTWLVQRARGGFGLTMTCAAHVEAIGQGFAGQLGCFSDAHVEGLTRLATGIHHFDSLAIVQLHHAGMRSPSELTGHAPVAPFADAETGARALSTMEVDNTIESFIQAAERCQRAGFDGVEIHGAHGYLLCQFLDAQRNRRSDPYGGDLTNRSRIIFDIIRGVRTRCGDDFHVGLRLSPERFGVATTEILEIFRRVATEGLVDLIDLSLWDTFKVALDEDVAGKDLLGLFTNEPRGRTRLAVAGRIYSGADVQLALDLGADIVALGRAAITNHDFPLLVQQDPNVAMRSLPVSASTLADEGLSPRFIDYMRGWRGFVDDPSPAS